MTILDTTYSVSHIIGFFFILFGIIIQLFGIYGFIRYNNLYVRLSISSLIDTAGPLLILVGVMFYSGFSFTTLKIVLIFLLLILLNPLTNHVIGRGAYMSNYHPETPPLKEPRILRKRKKGTLK